MPAWCRPFTRSSSRIRVGSLIAFDYTRAYASRYESTIPEDSAALLRLRCCGDLQICQRLTGVEIDG